VEFGYTLIKSGLDLKHSPKFPTADSGRNRGILEIRTATASTNPFSNCTTKRGQKMRPEKSINKYNSSSSMNNNENF